MACSASGEGNDTTTTFNVRDFGAVGNGQALDTAAIDRAVKACAKAGGGTVRFPAGQYVSGTFRLLDHVTLDLESGATLVASTNLSDYGLKTEYGIDEQKIGQSGEGLKVGMIVANGAENVGIIGHGTIDGRGTYFVDVNAPHVGDGSDFDRRYTRQGTNFLNPRRFKITSGPVKPWMAWSNRPGVLITFANCTNVLLRDVTIKDSHNWTINIGQCENVEVSGLDVLNNPLIPNNDGLDISAKNARISDCDIQTGDDAIAANRCENLVVANCILSSRSSAIRFGDGRDCTFEDLVIRESNRGIGIYGTARGVLFSGIVIQTRLFNGHWWGKSEPIHISVAPGTGRPAVSNVRFSNISAESESGILIYGTEPGAIQDLSFDHIKLRIKAGEDSEAVGGNFDLRGLGFGLDRAIFKHDIPAVYCQYADGIQIHGFDLEWASDLPDYFSSGIDCEYFKDLIIDGFKGRQAQKAGGSAIRLVHGGEVSIRNCEATQGTDTFLSLDDVKDGRMFVNNDLTEARQTQGPSQSEFETISGNTVPSASSH